MIDLSEVSAIFQAILTQLPNRESGAEFWQMVLDVDAQAILLLLTHAEFNMFHANGDFVHFDGSHVRVGEFKRVVIDRDWTMHICAHASLFWMDAREAASSTFGLVANTISVQIAHERLHSDNFQRLVIADCICRARQGRMHAVQRAIQLQTIHAAMMEHIMSTRVSAQLPTKTTQKYEEFMDRFNKCAEAQEDLQ
ncbi:hypothetical protein OSTOST_11832 [Ostertagia ostertagi]